MTLDPLRVHGEPVPEQRHTRWCAVCAHGHGILYPCEHYSAETLAAIEAESQRLCENIANGSAFPPGTPEIVKGVLRMLAGVEPWAAATESEAR